MGISLNFLKIAAAVVAAVLPSLVQAFIPSISDHIGSIRALVDASSGETVAEYAYDPYGVLLEEAGPKASSCPFRFSSKYYDSETGLMYFGYRYYNPVSTKWLTVDPLQERGGLNVTAYCAGDPVNRVDPLGLQNVVSDGRNVYQESGNWSDPTSFRNLNASGFDLARLPLDVAVECGIRPVSEWSEKNTYATEFNGILPSGYLPYHRGKGLGSELVAGAYNVVPLVGNTVFGALDRLGSASVAIEGVCEDVTGCGSAELMMNMYQTGWVPGACAGAIPYSLGVAGNTLRAIVPRVAMSAAIARGPALGSVEAAAIGGGKPMVGDATATAIKNIETSRKLVARDFYRSGGWSEEKIALHLREIDFSKPVDVVSLPKGTHLVQHTYPGDRLGNYFAYPGTAARGLGIYPHGRIESLVELLDDTPTLRSTAADVIDSWSVPGLPIHVPGGNCQLFILH